ncbi:RluA family pseudouridine synthase [Blautia sp. HCP3S3_H10_1]|uniref:RluA family pseudouridine synthase n=1 Tax=unclassified Blautia TaxID=2648079 RepID=UPI003F90EC10|nr:RluA family pseudouridine synthase [Clostridia bacterium]
MERYLEMKVTESGKVGDVLRAQAGLTKRQISQAKFRPDGICKNGKQCRVTENVVCGDVLRVCVETKEIKAGLENYSGNCSEIHGENFSVSDNENDSGNHNHSGMISANDMGSQLLILYEDQDLLAVSKPAGVVTHPSGRHYADSLSNQVAEYFKRKGEDTRIRSIGRLDKETSGILLFARNQIGASRLQKQREEGKLQKTYVAVVQGNLPIMENKVMERLEMPLAPDPDNRMKMVISPEGKLPGSKNAITYFHVLENLEDTALVKLQLETGRTHQIRVHMAGIGHPLLGDTLYHADHISGKKDREQYFTRAALHAWKLAFFHPFTGEKIELEAPFPADFVDFIQGAIYNSTAAE